MSKQFTVGFIGCGKRAHIHAPAVRDEARCRVTGLADVSREAAEKMNSEFDFKAKLYSDHREMLAKEKPDLIVTCLWTPLHLPVFRDCVQAGVKAVLSEKPMAPTWGECKDIARLAEESKCQLTFSHQRRFAKGNLLAKQLIEEGRFGEILRMDLYSPPNLLDCGTHTFDQALSFNRETPAKWVLGAIDASEPLNWFNVKSEGMATGLVVFANGVRAYIQVGGPDKDQQTGVRVIGSKGFIEVEWDGQFGRAVVYDDPSWKPEQQPPDEKQIMRDYLRDAIDSLIAKREPVLSHRKALRAAEIIFAFYESVRRHARVELPVKVDDNAFLTMMEQGVFGVRPQ